MDNLSIIKDMNKKDLLLSYLFAIPAVFLAGFFHINFQQWVFIIIFMIVYPIIFGLLNKTTTPVWVTTLTPLLFILILLCGYNIGLNDYIKIATTDDIKKASEIENIISARYYNSIRFIDGTKYTIALRNANKDSYKDVVLSLIYDDVVTENVAIHIDTNSTAFSKKGYTSKLAKDLKKELPFLLNGIVGVYNSTADVEFSSCFFNMDCSTPYVKANVKIDTNESFDTEEINELTKKLLLSTIRGLTKENIKIVFNIEPCSKQDKCHNYQATQRLYRIAKDFYEQGNYINTLKYLEKANKIDSSYGISIENVKKIQELNKTINKTPSNYKLYIERGDLKNVPEYDIIQNRQGITSDYYGAIDDYTKALELNPKAYGIYEKRGDAWADCGYRACSICKLERTEQENANVIKDYELAIKYTGGNDNLFEKLGDRYATAAPEKALKYYNMISNQYPKYENTKRSYDYLPLKIAYRYADIENYENTFKIFDKILAYEENETIIQEVNDMKFYYNWKAGHYITALKNADSCSVWVCKALGIFF